MATFGDAIGGCPASPPGPRRMTGVLTSLNELGDQYSRNERCARRRIQGLHEPLLHGTQINPQHAVCPHDRPFVKCAERRVTKYRKFRLDTFDFAVTRNLDFDINIQIIVKLFRVAVLAPPTRLAGRNRPSSQTGPLLRTACQNFQESAKSRTRPRQGLSRTRTRR